MANLGTLKFGNCPWEKNKQQAVPVFYIVIGNTFDSSYLFTFHYSKCLQETGKIKIF